MLSPNKGRQACASRRENTAAGSQLTERILKEALALVDEAGLDAFDDPRLRSAARRGRYCGVPLFPNKDELILADTTGGGSWRSADDYDAALFRDFFLSAACRRPGRLKSA